MVLPFVFSFLFFWVLLKSFPCVHKKVNTLHLVILQKQRKEGHSRDLHKVMTTLASNCLLCFYSNCVLPSSRRWLTPSVPYSFQFHHFTCFILLIFLFSILSTKSHFSYIRCNLIFSFKNLNIRKKPKMISSACHSTLYNTVFLNHLSFLHGHRRLGQKLLLLNFCHHYKSLLSP